MGLTVERRAISIDEVPSFDELGAVGTAAVVTPVNKLVYKGKDINFDDNHNHTIEKLYKTLTGIQYGDIEDKFNWLHEIK